MSTSAMHVAKTGLTAQQYKMQVIANNLANVNTTGFKRDRANFESLFYQIVKNAKALSTRIQERGIAVVSKGTDNHIVLLDLRSIELTGKEADSLVSEVNITANKNTVPFDPQSPFVTSGLRLGSAALTTRGFNEQAFEDVGNVIADRLLNPNDEDIKAQSINKVSELCNKFPLYSENI